MRAGDAASLPAPGATHHAGNGGGGMARLGIALILLLLVAGLLHAQDNLLANPAFADGTAGWGAMWTLTPGSGMRAVVPGAGHEGMAALRIGQRGDDDWAIEQERRIAVATGERFALGGWVQGEAGSGTVTLSVVTRTSADAVMEWEFARQECAGVHAWQHLAGRFLVPPDCASITLRITGRGPLTALVSALELVRLAAAPHADLPAEPLRIAGGGTSLVWSASARQLTLSAAGGARWTFAGLGSALPVGAVQAAPDRMRVALRAADGDLTAEFRADPDGSVRCLLSGSGALDGEVRFPGALRAAAGQSWVLPLNEGLLVPGDDPHFAGGQLQLYCGHGLCMPFVGLVAGEQGLLAIAETQDDAEVDLEGAHAGAGIAATFVWQGARGAWAYPRALRLVPVSGHGYVGVAKAYRAWAARDGRVVTLAEKATSVPQVAQLIGAVDVWWWLAGESWAEDPHPERAAQAMRAAGIERALWSHEAGPEAIEGIRALGYLPGRYDIYQDVYAPETPASWVNKAGWPDDLVLLKDGSWMKGWVIREQGTEFPGGVVCAKPGLERLRATVAADLATHHYGARFLDTTTASPLRECWNPRHPLSRSDDRGWKVAQLRAISGEFKLVCGSETGMDLAAPVVHYFEGMMSLGPYRLPDAGYDLFSYRAPQEDFLRFQTGPFYRIPLVELVYHDCLVNYWYWGDASNRVPEAWDDRDLLNALYGTPPVFVLDQKRWDADHERFVRSYRLGGETARIAGGQEMTEHAFLSADHTLQRSRFADGTTVWANFAGQDAFLADGTVIPAKRHRLQHVP
jgi:hypothetical protein